MKGIALIVGAVALGFVAHKLVGKHVDPAVTKVHDRLKGMVKKGVAAEVVVEVAEAPAEA